MTSTVDFRRLERWLVVLIAIHSAAVGLVLLFFTRWGTTFGGWPGVQPLFFARQGGIFHLVVACGYLIEYFCHGTVTFLLVAKIIAVLFLTGMMLVEPGNPWALPFSALGDGLMAVLVYWVHRRAQLERA